VASAVSVSHLWQDGDVAHVHHIVRRNLRFCWLIMLTGSSFLIVFGKQVFDIWLGPGNFVGLPVLGVFLVTEALSTQSYVISLSSRATEDEAFAVCSITGGILKLLFSYIFIRFFGLVGLACGTALAMLLTNQWYMVYRGLKRLAFPFPEYFKMLLPFALLFPITIAALSVLAQIVHEIAPLARLVCAAAASGLVFALAVYFLILDRAQALRVFDLLKRSKC
jgi:O-antigen/teichoic acid export membrane protein